MRRTTSRASSRMKAASSAARTQGSNRSRRNDARQQEHVYGGQRKHGGDCKSHGAAYQRRPGPQARRRQQRRHGTSPDDRQIPPVRRAALVAHARDVHPDVCRNPDRQAQRQQPNPHVMTVLRFFLPLAAANTAANHVNSGRCAATDMITDIGWPGRSIVGDDGADAAWLLVQHADHDPAFQRQCLELLTVAARHGEATNAQVAYLTDRVLLAEGKPQEFGTQTTGRNGQWVPCDLRDPGHVDQRRAAMSLGSLADNLARITEEYGPPTPPVIT